MPRKPKKTPPSSPSSPRVGKWSPERFNTLPRYDAIKTAGQSEWNPATAKHAIQFIEGLCKFTEGSWAGKPFVLLPWQRALVANLYGWIKPDGTRRYRQAHILVPRKAGKTELAAALALYHLLADEEPTPEVVGIARDRSQAGLCLRRAMRMAAQEPLLSARTEPYQSRLTAPQVYGVYKVLSADAPGAHGLNVSACIADEIHAMENRRDLWEAVMTSMGARRQPLMISITTAGVLRESLEHDLFQYALRVCDGVIDNPAFLPCLHFADAADDWRLESTWRKANPSLTCTSTLDWYRQEAQRAHDQPSYESPFRTYYLCQHITAAERWIRMADWDACEEQFDVERLRGLPCYLGIDLAQTTDISSISCVWLDGDSLYVKNWNYAPEVGATNRMRKDGVPYVEWARRGWMTLTPGDTTDYSYLVSQIERIAAQHKVKMVAYDPYNAQNLANDLEHRGIPVVRVPQSFLNLATPTRMWEQAIVSRRLRHDGNPVLSWAMSNCVVDRDANDNPRPSKRRSVERIDPVIAGIIAIAASLHDEKPQPSVYNERGLIWL